MISWIIEANTATERYLIKLFWKHASLKWLKHGLSICLGNIISGIPPTPTELELIKLFFLWKTSRKRWSIVHFVFTSHALILYMQEYVIICWLPSMGFFMHLQESKYFCELETRFHILCERKVIFPFGVPMQKLCIVNRSVPKELEDKCKINEVRLQWIVQYYPRYFSYSSIRLITWNGFVR